MSEVTTLKELMLDAARYRWLRGNLYAADFMDFIFDPKEFDEAVDAELAKENP